MGRALLKRNRGYLGEVVEQRSGGDADKAGASPWALI
jgi:hypothetical protein